MRKISRAEEFQPWVNYRTAASVELPAGHSAADVIRHDKGHDDWHAMHGDGPCKSEADCARMRKNYKDDEDKNVHHAKKEEGGEKSFKPPKGVQSAARHALQLIEDGKAGDGFTSVGRGRAHQLANGESVSLAVIKKMHSYFARHAVDKKGKDWDNNSPGKVAWLAWGGDAGRAWANGIMRDHGDKDNESKKKEGSVVTAEAYPDKSHYLKPVHKLVEENKDSVDWHEQRGQSDEAEKHKKLISDLKVVEHDINGMKSVGTTSFKKRYASEKTANQYVKKQGDKWVVLNKEGKVLSHHDSKEKADASFSAMMANKHG
jgi:hypothetical protein